VWGWSFREGRTGVRVILIVDLTFLVQRRSRSGMALGAARIAIVLYFVMITWKKGREILGESA